MSFTPVSIDELLDGENIRQSSAKFPFNQDSLTFKGSAATNPPSLIHVILQAQLETRFGSNIELDDTTAFTIVVDESFTLAKPFKLGLSTSLELLGTIINNGIIYAGSTAMFQNVNPANPITTLFIHDINLSPDGPNRTLFDLKTPSFFFMDSMAVSAFENLGLVEDVQRVNIALTGFFNATTGLILKNAGLVNISNTEIGSSTSSGITFLTFISSALSKVTLLSISGRQMGPEDSLLFLDPNSHPDTTFIIAGCEIDGGNFYQKGVDIAVDNVIDSGGIAEFNTAIDHNLSVGDKVVLSGFVTAAYNHTGIVTAINAMDKFETGVIFVNDVPGVLENRPVPITMVADNGSVKCRYTTVSSHGLVVGKPVVIKDFTVETSYNETVIVTAVDTDFTGVTFDTDQTFTGNDVGTLDARSLDQTDPRVTAQGNPGQANSMIQGEIMVKSSSIEVISSPATEVPLEDIAPAIGDFTENPENELMILNTQTGELEYTGLNTIRVVPTYTIAASIVGGGSQILEFALFRDEGLDYVEVPNTRIDFNTADITSKVFAGTFFNMNPGDKFKLFKVSNSGTNNTDINNGTKLMMLGES